MSPASAIMDQPIAQMTCDTATSVHAVVKYQAKLITVSSRKTSHAPRLSRNRAEDCAERRRVRDGARYTSPMPVPTLRRVPAGRYVQPLREGGSLPAVVDTDGG